MMSVIATAGHVDHGKSTLVRALTGTDPDRWAEEHRRGLTIDLGFVWTTLPTGQVVSFVDVPGHQRFIANMLAGLGPLSAVMLIVAADAGWSAQTTEHLDAVRALAITHGLVVLTRTDLADEDQIAATTAQVRRELHATPLASAPIVTCSATTGRGLGQVRQALAELCDSLPPPATDASVRLWIDRAFTMRGAGTIVTGTLAQGTVQVGEELDLLTPRRADRTAVRVRALQSLDQPHRAVRAPARVALNLRGKHPTDISRGDLLLTPAAWHLTSAADIRLELLADAAAPEYLMAHVGTRADQVRLRPLGADTARLAWPVALPLRAGDRIVLRDPGRHLVLAGGQVLDVDPPVLARRGAARERARELAGAEARVDVVAEVARRGYLPLADARNRGATDADLAAAVDGGQVRQCAGLLVGIAQWDRWARALREVVTTAAQADPLQARIALGAATDAAGIPRPQLTAAIALENPDLEERVGYLAVRGHAPSLGAAQAGLDAALALLDAEPFRAPEREELAAWGLGPHQLALAARQEKLIDLGGQVVLAPRAPALAMRTLAGLPQPFTTSQARQALGSTRRVIVPLLEELDRRGWTRRIDAGHREVVR